MKDFELVIVDALYEQRKEYFKNADLPFKVKHIPALPNVWIENGVSGMSTQYNLGIIHADGELLFVNGDSHMMLPDFMQKLWARYQEGYFPLAWYQYDNTFAKVLPMDLNPYTVVDSTKRTFDLAYPTQDVESPFSYNILGYEGKKVTIEHRYSEAFKNNSRNIHFASWGWWFGCSSASLEAMLKINGFNQMFDGDCALNDCDVGSRIEMAGYGGRFALFRDIFLICASTQVGEWNDNFKKNTITIKCNFPLLWMSRLRNDYKANMNKINDADINWITTVYCKKLCTIRKNCKKNYPWQYPFIHKSGPNHPPNSISSEELFDFWKEHQTVIDLTEERKLRKNGEKYQEGTFI